MLQNDNQDEEIRNMSDNQKEWLCKVESLLAEKRYDLAERLFYGIFKADNGNINLYWLNTESAVLDWMFRVNRAETESGVNPIFDRLSHIDAMLGFYYKLKFLVRRFEFDFPVEWKKELLSYVTEYKVSTQALIQMIEACVLHKTKVYNELVVFFTEYGKEEYRVPLLMASFQTQDFIVEMDGRNDEPGIIKYQNEYYQQVMALDGVFLMTSHNVEWREDMFTGWHMYDVSQSMEFLRKGYKVVIPKTENIWILHDEKYHTRLDSGYHRARLDYLKEYRKELTNEKLF